MAAYIYQFTCLPRYCRDYLPVGDFATLFKPTVLITVRNYLYAWPSLQDGHSYHVAGTLIWPLTNQPGPPKLLAGSFGVSAKFYRLQNIGRSFPDTNSQTMCHSPTEKA